MRWGAGHKQASHVRGARRTVGILLGGGGEGSRRKSSQDVYPRAAPGGMRTGRAVVKNARRTLCENLVVKRAWNSNCVRRNGNKFQNPKYEICHLNKHIQTVTVQKSDGPRLIGNFFREEKSGQRGKGSYFNNA